MRMNDGHRVTHRSPFGSVTRNAMCVKVVSSSAALFQRTLQSSRATSIPSASSAIPSKPFIWKQLRAHTAMTCESVKNQQRPGLQGLFSGVECASADSLPSAPTLHELLLDGRRLN